MKKNYLLTTQDGSTTLFLEEYEQAMHSISGAYEESLLKHVLPSGILENNNEVLNVLDIGFGLGYNVLVLISEFLNKNRNCKLNIFSLEKDRNFSEYMENIKFNDSRDIIYNFIREVYLSGEGIFKGINFKILFGDARETLKKISDKKFHAIFQDPFSPSKNPELWSINYFIELKKILAEGGIITTYSSADHIRRAMIESGLYIGRGPSVGKKREGTLASSSSKIIPELSENEIADIISNIKSIPYEDRLLNLERGEILECRLLKIRLLKEKNIK